MRREGVMDIEGVVRRERAKEKFPYLKTAV